MTARKNVAVQGDEDTRLCPTCHSWCDAHRPGCPEAPQADGMGRCACKAVRVLSRTGFGVVPWDNRVHSFLACVIYRNDRTDLRGAVEDAITAAAQNNHSETHPRGQQ